MVTTLNTALRIELVGQEALVHDAAGGLVVRLTGDEHSVIVRLTNGEQIVDPTEGEQAAIDRLIEAGIVLDAESSSSSKFSRRRVMQLSAAGVAAAGLSYLVLPSAAAASSGPGYPLPPEPIPPTPGGATPGTTRLTIDGLSDPIQVAWRSTTATGFDFVWAVYSSSNTLLASGTGTAGTNGSFGSSVSTGVLPVTGQVVRYFTGGTVVDRPVTAPPS